MDLYNMKIYLILLFFVVTSFAQSLKYREQQLSELEKEYIQKKDNVNSLKSDLNKFLEQLEQVKKDEPQNKDKISSMLADALNQSNRIDTTEKELKILDLQLNKKRRTLYRIYSSQIDSLNKIAHRSVSKSDKEQLELKLRILNDKRLYVSPLVPQLSFDPKVVEKINLAQSEDEKERSIYKNYLDNALNEVDSSIDQIQKRSDEIHEVIKLNELTEDFMEDIDGNQFAGSYVISEQIENPEQGGFRTFPDNIIADKNTVTQIYNRISPFIQENINRQDFSIQDSVYSEDYLKLLEETEHTLRLYRDKIKDKLQK